MGKVRRKATKYELKLFKTAEGYMQAQIYDGKGDSRQMRVHRLVYMGFVDGMDQDDRTLTVHHINNIRDDNRLANLRLATYQEQNQNRDKANLNRGHRVPVEQRTLDGVLIARYGSHTEAAAAIAGSVGRATLANIQRCSRTATGTAYGYVWRRVEDDTIEGEVWKSFTDTMWISNKGRYKRRTKGGRFLPAKDASMLGTNYGYPRVGQHRLHNVVGKLFLDPPACTSLIINHKDGNIKNADSTNLEWATRSENSQHAHDTGLIKCKRAVVQMDADGKDIALFDSISKAKKHIGTSNIGRAIKYRKTCAGFLWKYAVN